MKNETLQAALAAQQKVKQLQGARDAIRARTKPAGPNATPQQLETDGHSLVLKIGPQPLTLVLPGHLAQKFMDETERYYDGELLSAEREFERL